MLQAFKRINAAEDVSAWARATFFHRKVRHLVAWHLARRCLDMTMRLDALMSAVLAPAYVHPHEDEQEDDDDRDEAPNDWAHLRILN